MTSSWSPPVEDVSQPAFDHGQRAVDHRGARDAGRPADAVELVAARDGEGAAERLLVLAEDVHAERARLGDAGPAGRARGPGPGSTIGGSRESAENDWQEKPTGMTLLERGDDGDPGGEVAEHLAEPGLVEARWSTYVCLGLAEVDRLGLVGRRHVLDRAWPRGAGGPGSECGRARGRCARGRGARAAAAWPPTRRPRGRRRRRSSGPSRPWPRTRRRCTGRRGSGGRRPGRARARPRGWPGGRAGPGGRTCRPRSDPRPRSGSPASTPACGMGRAMTLAEPMEKSSSRASMVISSPRNCSMWIGNTGGCTAACSASFRVPLGWRRPVHGEAGPGVVQRAEERDPQDVVEVEMGEQRRGVHRASRAPAPPRCRTSPSAAQAGAQVDDERLVPLDVDHEARGVAPVAPVAIPRARARPPHAVERDVHPRDVTRPGAVRSAPMEQRTISANGLEFAYLDDGPDDGPLALCLHGFPDTAHTWRYLLPELAGAGFHAVAPFLRGYAPTALPADGHYQVGALVARRQRAARGARGRRRRRHRRPRLGRPGHLRRGGAPARPLAPRRHGGGAPDGVHRHVAVHLRAAAAQLVHVLLPLPAGRGGAAARGLLVHRPPLARLVTGLRRRLGRGPGQGVHRRPRAHAGRHRLLPRAATTPRSRCPSWPTSRRRSLLPTPKPTLYLHGRDDNCMLLSSIGIARSTSWPRAPRMEVVDGAGHFLHVERPDVVNRHIVEFPDRLLNAPAWGARLVGPPSAQPEDGIRPAGPPGEALGHQRRRPPARPAPGRRASRRRRPAPRRPHAAVAQRVEQPPPALAVRPGEGALRPGRRAQPPRVGTVRRRRGARRTAGAAGTARSRAAPRCTRWRPRSNIAWLNSHDAPGGTRRSPSARRRGAA